MLFAGDDAEALGDGACTIANNATRVNIANIAKDFMGFSFFRLGSLPTWANPILYSLNANRRYWQKRQFPTMKKREKNQIADADGRNDHQTKIYKPTREISMKSSEKASITYIETKEQKRLNEARETGVPWKKWGPYLSERQWGTVREDYSQDGNAWDYFNHDQARSRAYRWGEDGLAGISDDKQQLCFAIALWNGRDPILKERLFGLTNSEGNHGEDVKEYYFYLDSTPTHSYMKYLYKYPQGEFPYRDLIETNRKTVTGRVGIRTARYRDI